MKDWDCIAYENYPQLRNFFNKLWVAEQMGYDCGPAGTEPTKSDTYVVRPIYNLSGMGAGARVQKIEAGDDKSVEPGYFWCEYFNGEHLSIDYTFQSGQKGEWIPVHGCSGINFPINLSKFSEWRKIDVNTHPLPDVPKFVQEAFQVPQINIEFVDGKIIEIHLRESIEMGWDHMIPIWDSTTTLRCEELSLHGYKWIDDFDDADTQLKDPRLGFLVKDIPPPAKA